MEEYERGEAKGDWEKREREERGEGEEITQSSVAWKQEITS